MVRLSRFNRLNANHPRENWNKQPSILYRYYWFGQTRAWESMLAEWDADELEAVQPRGQNGFPYAGFSSINDWAIKRGEARQRELIGMTAEAELPAEGFQDRIVPTNDDS